MKLKKLLGILMAVVMVVCLTTVAFAAAEPTGTITPCYTRSDAFWGEGTSNSTESFVVELYEGNTKIASATLGMENGGALMDGDVYVTWAIPFDGEDSDYWDVEWAEGYPKYDMNPATVKLIADGKEVATNAVQYNAPDNLNKIVALAEGFTGGVKAYTSLVDAMGNFNGRQVNVLRDVTEEIEDMNGATLTTNVEGGVTVTSTYSGYVYANDLNIGKGVTVKAEDSFFYETDGVNTVEGTLEVANIFYHGYDAKTTVQNGGSIKVGGSTILRYNESADAGLYIYGDNDDSTVEFDCDYYIGAYSGTFYAEDANIETGYFLLKNSYDDSTYADIAMTLDNSSLTVVGTSDGQDSFIIDDQASLTLTNDASIEDVRDFSILTGANLNLSVDNTSSIGATNVNIAADVPLDYKDGEIKVVVAMIGETKYADLHEAMVAAKAGETVELQCDVDLSGIEWEPVSFSGNFDGNEYTISNLTINKPGVSKVGFVTSLNGTIENVTFTNPTVTGGECTGVVAGRAGGVNSLAQNITVNGTIKVETTHSGYARAGVIVGGWAYGNYKNITVDGGDKAVSYIKHTGGGDGRYVAGIVGHADDVDSYVNCTVKNITISGGWLCGGIAGPGPASSTASGCLVENVNINADYSGGMFGWYYVPAANTGSISDSTVKNVTFTAGSACNGAIGGYAMDKDVTVTNVTIENVVNANGKPLSVSFAATVTSGENTAYYATIQAALDAVMAGDTITLLGDVEVDEEVYIRTANVTIDGNGYAITPSDSFKDNIEGQHNLMKIEANGVTVKNLTLKTTDLAKHALDVYGSENVVLENVTLDHSVAEKGAALIINQSDVTVKGDFTVVVGDTSWYGINIDDKDVEGSATLTFADDADVTFTDKSTTQDKLFIYVETGTDAETAVVNPENAGLQLGSNGQYEPIPVPTLYTITKAACENGKVTAQAVMASAGSTIKVSAEPAEGYKLVALVVTDAAGNEIEVVDGKIKMPASNITVSATFVYDLPFTDVADDNEHYAAIAYMYVNGLMIGTSEDEYVFSGEMTMTRAQIAQILYRLAGEPAAEYAGTFTDAPEGAWYTEAVEWAAAEGIVNGVGNDKFAPNREITVTELAALVYRYAQCQLTGECQAADWETESVAAMTWCVDNGILAEGTTVANRYLAADMFYNVYNLLNK